MSARSKARKRALDVLFSAELRGESPVEALQRVTTDGSPIAAAPVAVRNTLVVVTRNGGVFGLVPE